MTEPKKSDSFLFQYAVITDSHIRLPNATEEGGYASNRLTIERAKYVVQCLNSLQPSFVIHLGDLVHPIPVLNNHEGAVQKARHIFSGIESEFYTLPGNHDIGDKPNAWLPAPVVEEDSHLVFLRGLNFNAAAFYFGEKAISGFFGIFPGRKHHCFNPWIDMNGNRCNLQHR